MNKLSQFPEGTNPTDPFIAASWPPGQAEKLISAASGPLQPQFVVIFFFMVAPGDFYRQGLGLDVEVCWSHSAGGKCGRPSVKSLWVGHVLTGALSGGRGEAGTASTKSSRAPQGKSDSDKGGSRPSDLVKAARQGL